ncbi:MAG: hypothetical protein AAF231_03930, partial [Pseudomonadota bacterium]
MFKTADKKPGVWTLMRPVMGRIVIGMATASLGTTASLFAVASLALVVHAVVTDAPVTVFGASWDVMSLVMISIGLTVLTVVFRSIAFMVSHFAAYLLEHDLRTDISDHMAKMPLGAIVSSGSG